MAGGALYDQVILKMSLAFVVNSLLLILGQPSSCGLVLFSSMYNALKGMPAAEILPSQVLSCPLFAIALLASGQIQPYTGP